MNFLVEKEDYDFYGHASGYANEVAITLLKGEFQGVAFSVSNVQVEEKKDEKGDDVAYLGFEFNVLELANWNKEELDANETFKSTIGDVLLSILMKSIEDSKENRENDVADLYEADEEDE